MMTICFLLKSFRGKKETKYGNLELYSRPQNSFILSPLYSFSSFAK